MVQKVMERIWSVEKYWSKALLLKFIVMLVLINTVLNMEHHWDSGKIKDRLIL